jgi:hypothetical protein
VRKSLRLGTHIGALLRRPMLLVEAVRALLALRRHGGPGSSTAYLHWRTVTAYGSDAAFPSRDLLEFLAWRKRMRSLARRKAQPASGQGR